MKLLALGGGGSNEGREGSDEDGDEGGRFCEVEIKIIGMVISLREFGQEEIKQNWKKYMDEFINRHFPDAVKVNSSPYYSTRRVFLLDETERIVEIDIWEGVITCFDIWKPPIIRCRECGFYFTSIKNTCECKENQLYVDIESMYHYYRYSKDEKDKLEIIRQVASYSEEEVVLQPTIKEKIIVKK